MVQPSPFKVTVDVMRSQFGCVKLFAIPTLWTQFLPLKYKYGTSLKSLVAPIFPDFYDPTISDMTKEDKSWLLQKCIRYLVGRLD